ncbi:ABC transporter ATP-binding protein [Arthrobacter sp. M4]|uniref:ABC transporter ATP-binding protein n=1 Tax=Arthrobacter sp. M4 TaxID=218160 RepID=UPI001CDC9B7C|nr:ABC transporter ATP-binding protein [Arthrobacter sp. M4]MCA4133449.1 ABC transporter ATP-binding protein [Arthrobacter sp. M4]
MIEFRNVEVRFGDFVALPDFQLEVGEGEFFTLLGPSGCGKSTALRTLAGFIEPASGQVRIEGKDVTHLPSHRRGIGMVFQNYALFPTLSVGENIAFGLKTAKTPAAEVRSRVGEIARQVNLTPEQLGKNVAELSGGQQQRVAIARALVLRPKILLLDEPLSNLDAALRKQLRVQLKELQQQFGITSVYVTHDQDEALTLSDRIAVMRDGRIEQVATPQDIYSRSATEFVCNFVGEAIRLSSADVAVLAARGGGVDPARPDYLRVEKVKIADDGGTSPTGAVALSGHVASRTYHGMFSTYRVDTAGGQVRAIVKEDGRRSYAQGDSVKVLVDPTDVLQYATSEPHTEMLSEPMPAGVAP